MTTPRVGDTIRLNGYHARTAKLGQVVKRELGEYTAIAQVTFVSANQRTARAKIVQLERNWDDA